MCNSVVVRVHGCATALYKSESILKYICLFDCWFVCLFSKEAAEEEETESRGRVRQKVCSGPGGQCPAGACGQGGGVNRPQKWKCRAVGGGARQINPSLRAGSRKDLYSPSAGTTGRQGSLEDCLKPLPPWEKSWLQNSCQSFVWLEVEAQGWGAFWGFGRVSRGPAG